MKINKWTHSYIQHTHTHISITFAEIIILYIYLKEREKKISHDDEKNKSIVKKINAHMHLGYSLIIKFEWMKIKHKWNIVDKIWNISR